MQQQDNILPFVKQLSYFGSAVVNETENSSGQVRVCWQQGSQSYSALVNIAVLRDEPLEKGSLVLIAGNDLSSLFVIGLLNTLPRNQEKAKISINGGAFAQREIHDENEMLTVYSDKKELLFKYDPTSKTSSVNFSQGDLELNATQGSISLNAGKRIEINSDSLALNSKKLSIKAIMAEMISGRLETHTDTLIENAKNVYRTVKELSQLHTGRQRTFVEETSQLNADKILIKSENDVKVKAEKIHLG